MSAVATVVEEPNLARKSTRFRLRRWPRGELDHVLDQQMFPVRIGSAKDNDVVVKHPSVCPYHCRLITSDQHIWLQDVGSVTGTWVDGARVERVLLCPPVQWRMGEVGLSLVGASDDGPFHGIVGQHPLMRRLFEQIECLAAFDIPVLIQGESGTGKELVARALHASSRCSQGPFEVINCGSIPHELAESELFGHQRGAFTGAVRHYEGAFQRADGGTLCLDEVGELPLSVQPKLLRVLEEGVIRSVGAEQGQRVKVRILAATHRDLERSVEHGEFRLDLYHRLAVGMIRVPALRERREDISLLMQHFIKQWSNDLGVSIMLNERVKRRFSTMSWHGNVRALKHALWRAVMLGSDAQVMRTASPYREQRAPLAVSREGYVRCEGRRFTEIKRDVFLNVIKQYEGNRSAAAVALGIPKSTFFDQLRLLEL